MTTQEQRAVEAVARVLAPHWMTDREWDGEGCQPQWRAYKARAIAQAEAAIAAYKAHLEAEKAERIRLVKVSGGKARWAGVSPEGRSEFCRNMVNERWRKAKELE